MTILVTGGLGQVGSWTAYNLAKQGQQVIIFDPAVKSFENLGMDYLNEVRENLILINGDVLDFQNLCEVFYKYEIKGIIHSSAVIGIPEFNQRAYQNVSLNTVGTLNVLEAARIFGIKKFVYVSSGSVYGETRGILSEELPYNPSDLYGSTKVAGELFALHYANAFAMDVRIARVYFVYGPGKLPSRMYPLYRGIFGPLEGIYHYKAETGADTELDWTHVWDVAQGITKIYQKESLTEKVFNISSGIKVSLAHVVETVKDVVGKDTDVYIGPGASLKRGAPLDISRAREEVDFEPMFENIRDGIKNYLEWIQKHKN